MGVCGLHTTVAELDQNSVSAIVATRVGTDYIALIMMHLSMLASVACLLAVCLHGWS